MSANGRVPEVATSLSLNEATSSSAFAHRDPEVLPGGAATLFTFYHGPEDSLAELAVLAADAEAPRVLLTGVNPRYSPTGHIVFVRDQALWAAPFDLEHLELTGEPTPVVDGVLTTRLGGAVGWRCRGAGRSPTFR